MVENTENKNLSKKYDAVIVVSFGGPEGVDDVIPFLDNVLRGRNVPEERKLEVAEHYYHYNGISPINGQNRQLVQALENELAVHGVRLPVYLGNRNWHPYIADTLREMMNQGYNRILAFVTSSFSSYSGCRQYREDIESAQESIGEGAPIVDKIRVFYNHPGFIESNVERIKEAFSGLPKCDREKVQLVFTAHSIPRSMAKKCRYETQLTECVQLIADALDHKKWNLVYQSRSGSPHQPWLEPDICDYLSKLNRMK